MSARTNHGIRPEHRAAYDGPLAYATAFANSDIGTYAATGGNRHTGGDGHRLSDVCALVDAGARVVGLDPTDGSVE